MKINYLPFLVILLHIFILSLLSFTAWPEMSLWPYLVIKGWLPYKDIAIAHTPLMLIDLALWYKLFGVGLLQLKVYSWMLTATTSLAILYTAKALKLNTFVALVSYLFLHIIYEGNGLWFDSFLSLFAISSYYFIKTKNYKLGGINGSIMFFSKQTAFWFIVPIILTLKNVNNFKKYLLGFLTLSIILILVLLVFGIFDEFYKWAIEFGVFVLPRSQGQINFPSIKQLIFALLPISIVFVSAFKNNNKELALWALAGAMGAFPRFELFHFQPALPFLSLIISQVTMPVKREKITSFFLPIYVLIITLMFSRTLIQNFNKEDRFAEKSTIAVANYIDSKTDDNSKIFIINAWDNIYVFSNTLPATKPWVPHLKWYISQPLIEDELVSDLMNESPQLIIYKEFETYGLAAYRPEKIMNFIDTNYVLVDNIEGHLVLKKK